MIERLRRVSDPMRPRPLRPRPVDVVFAADAPLRAAMRRCGLSGKSTVSRKFHPVPEPISSTCRARACALAVRRMRWHGDSFGVKTLSASGRPVLAERHRGYDVG